MSTKLVKKSKGYEAARKKLVALLEENGGANITGPMIVDFVGMENLKKDSDEEKKSSGKKEKKSDEFCTEDEFYQILEDLSNEGYGLYKITQISKGKESRAMMICNPDSFIAFVKGDKKEEKEEKENSGEALIDAEVEIVTE